MVSRRVFALRAVLATVAVAALLILALSFEGPRSVLARGAFSAYLAWHGMYLARGDLRVATDRLTATGLQIHINTLKQRLERIDSLLGPQWSRPRLLLEVHIAMRLHLLATAQN